MHLKMVKILSFVKYFFSTVKEKETVMGYHYTPIRMSANTEYQMLTQTWKNWNFHTMLVGMQNGTTICKTVPFKLKHTNLPCDLVIPI